MNDTEKLIRDLRLLGKYSELEPNWLLVAADKIEELSKRVEVVRCKDCKWCKLCYPAKAIGEEAIEEYYCNMFKQYREPDDFCSYGERKESV